MEFLSNLHTDVKLLLVAGALALLAALVSATKKNEYRYMTVFSLVMLAAGWRFYAHEREAEAQLQAETRASARAEAPADAAPRSGSTRTKLPAR
ncbi:MAG TPA: hypothetical protein VFM98_18680 [Ramlibacter sp.]|uniref:hypothetical protein n=1 Tax=Ramlibacter sp. TaxID=1917967 RepID=UPI002D800241|nr:hypothetical protein [Ramlibacter sp.]HET8747631.1 hypothetical protein [Ramlibacter sp.]